MWGAAWARLQKKALAKKERLHQMTLRADSRGDEPPDHSNSGWALEPLARFTEDGALKWNETFVKDITKLATPPKGKKK